MDHQLLRDLSSPSAYPHRVDDVVVHQTHISVVFLAGPYAYKVKKPVQFGFVDYSSLEARRHFCEREVALNERLAPHVYLDVVGVVFDAQTQRHRVVHAPADSSQVLEWAVRMKRLDDAKTLGRRLKEKRLPPGTFDNLGRRLAQFHEQAASGEEISEAASFEAVKTNALDNFTQSSAHVGQTVHRDVFHRLQRLTTTRLERLRDLIAARAEANLARDTHGDLRLEHIYVEDDGSLFVVDCIEFNDAFRFSDPVSDIAFLAMDLDIRGYHAETRALLDAYVQARDDQAGEELVHFYMAYRSCVRAKVHGFKATEKEVPLEQRERATKKARAHWLYALHRLEAPGRGPCLVMLAGLPATGKSTLGRAMAERGEVDLLLETDAVRKELAGLKPTESAAAEIEAGIYTPEFSDKTYNEVGRRVEEALLRGRRVAVAASFVKEKRRTAMLAIARRLGVPARFVECVVSEPVARKRLQARTGDVSDADVSVYEKLKEVWEEPGEAILRIHETFDTT